MPSGDEQLGNLYIVKGERLEFGLGLPLHLQGPSEALCTPSASEGTTLSTRKFVDAYRQSSSLATARCTSSAFEGPAPAIVEHSQELVAGMDQHQPSRGRSMRLNVSSNL